MITDPFFSQMEEESDRLEKLHGSMSRVSYHRHYLPQEAVRKLDDFRVARRFHTRLSTSRLVDAAVSIMGQYNKSTNYNGDKDFNKDFVIAMKEAALIEKNIPDVEGTIELLVEYNNLWDKDKLKALNNLIKAAAAILSQYNKIEGF